MVASRTEVKKQMLALQKLGEALVKLDAGLLSTIPLEGKLGKVPVERCQGKVPVTALRNCGGMLFSGG